LSVFIGGLPINGSLRLEHNSIRLPPCQTRLAEPKFSDRDTGCFEAPHENLKRFDAVTPQAGSAIGAVENSRADRETLNDPSRRSPAAPLDEAVTAVVDKATPPRFLTALFTFSSPSETDCPFSDDDSSAPPRTPLTPARFHSVSRAV
jgi:hypothetical protein